MQRLRNSPHRNRRKRGFILPRGIADPTSACGEALNKEFQVPGTDLTPGKEKTAGV